MKNTSNEELIVRYEELARARGRAMNANDSRSANDAFDEETAIREELRSREPSAIRGLLKLLNSDDPWVQCDSAIPALFFAPEQAEPILERLVEREHRSLRVVARVTLDQWRKGELRFQ
jgi:hypothetical protein